MFPLLSHLNSILWHSPILIWNPLETESSQDLATKALLVLFSSMAGDIKGCFWCSSPDPNTLECWTPLSWDQTALAMWSSSHTEIGAIAIEPTNNCIWWKSSLGPGPHPLESHLLMPPGLFQKDF